MGTKKKIVNAVWAPQKARKKKKSSMRATLGQSISALILFSRSPHGHQRQLVIRTNICIQWGTWEDVKQAIDYTLVIVLVLTLFFQYQLQNLIENN